MISPLRLGIPYLLASAAVGFYFLLMPGYQLTRLQDGRQAAKLFDSASYYPLAQLAIITIFVFINYAGILR
jgi:hypothetical protein